VDGIESKAPAFDVARPEDVPDLVAIDALSPTPWTAAAFEEEARHVPPTLFVLREADRAVAFVSARVQSPDLDIVNVAVAAPKRRLGLGRTLICGLLDSPVARGIESVFLEVRASNAAALALYRGMGFKETQRRRNFYRDPVEDAVLMMLRLSHQ
jgi:ribosomal-protein-alanine N-acetyltransferase